MCVVKLSKSDFDFLNGRLEEGYTLEDITIVVESEEKVTDVDELLDSLTADISLQSEIYFLESKRSELEEQNYLLILDNLVRSYFVQSLQIILNKSDVCKTEVED